jgi:hypothetical protein
MRYISTFLLATCTFGGLCAISADASAQAANYCPLYADNNWRLSRVEEALHAWTKDQRGSTSFDPHLKFCKDVFRDDRDNALQILHDEWETRHARIVDRLPSWSAQDMVGYLHDWPNRMSYICDIYAGFNTGLSEIAQDLDVDIGSLVESEHRDYCVNTIYQNDDQGLEVQQAWAGRYDYVMQLVLDHAAR